jgi:DNA-binding NarL/FixJ family response regulator
LPTWLSETEPVAAHLPETADAVPAHDSGAQPRPGPIRVLIVDDQEAFRSAARLVVEMTDGFETVGETGDGAAALELVRELDPQLVLLDMRLPEIDGVEVTRRLSRDHPGIRVLALSTHDEYEGRALAAGAVAFVTKSAFGPDAVKDAWRRS